MWIHQNTVNSLVGGIVDQYLPWTIFDKDLSDQLMAAFPEFRKVCGPDTNISLTIDMTKNSILPFKMTMKDGILIGDEN